MNNVNLELIVLEYNLDFNGWVQNWHLTKTLTDAEKFRLSENRTELAPELADIPATETLPRIRVVHESFLPYLDKSTHDLDIDEKLQLEEGNNALVAHEEF